MIMIIEQVSHPLNTETLAQPMAGTSGTSARHSFKLLPKLPTLSRIFMSHVAPDCTIHFFLFFS